ncbi:MAG: hypothetical protein IM620_18640 [Cytophagales bacterium]|nr:hypothetical protein [Cytophagales bacterium]
MDNEYTVNDVINLAINGNVIDLQKAFGSVMQDKINSALEIAKQNIGQSLGTNEEE